MNPKGMSNAINFKDVDDFVPNVTPLINATRYGTDLEFSVNDLDNQIFMTLFPTAEGRSVTEAPKRHYFGWKNLFGGHHDMGLPLTYILQKGIEANVWGSVEDVLVNKEENKIIKSDDKGRLGEKTVLAQINYYDNGTKRINKYVYDSIGNQIKIEEYSPDGSIGIVWAFNYDNNGNQIKQIEYDSDGSIILWYEYVYDEKGNKIKDTRYNSDGSIAVWNEYEYDINGNMTKRTDCDINKLILYYEYEYDDAGNLVKDSLYNSDGTLIYCDWREYEYDSAGNKIKTINRHSDGSVSWVENEYDSKGNEIKYVYYNSDGSISGGGESEYGYDDSGNVIWNKRFDLYGNLNYREEYKYDASGNLIQELGYSGDDSFILWYEYEYDNIGNQIRYVSYNENGSKLEEYQYKYLSEILNSSGDFENETKIDMDEYSRFMAGYLAAMRYPEGKVEVMEPIDIESISSTSPRYWSVCACDQYNTGEMGAEIIDCGDYYEVKNCFIEYPYLIPHEIYDQFKIGFEFDLTLDDQNGKEDTIHNVVSYLNGEWILSNNGDPYDEDARYVELEEDGTIVIRSYNYGGGAWLGNIYYGSLFFTKDCIVHDVYFKGTETFEEYVTKDHPYPNEREPWFQGGKHDNISIFFNGKVIFDPSTGMIIECQEIYQP